MPTPPRSKRFQIHLSTAIVMMFVAGVLIWANTHSSCKVFGLTSETNLESDRAECLECTYGWPGVAGIRIGFFNHNLPNEIFYQETYVRYGSITFNSIIAILILLVVWLLCEWLIRRRAARKGG